jgi:hypothetical protein
MSGGAFDYKQYNIAIIADEVEQIILNNGRPKTQEELRDENWSRNADWYERYPEDLNHYKYPDDVIEEFKKGLDILRKAQVYAQRIDWLVSCDDSEESFHRRLKEDLDKLAK